MPLVELASAVRAEVIPTIADAIAALLAPVLGTAAHIPLLYPLALAALDELHRRAIAIDNNYLASGGGKPLLAIKPKSKIASSIRHANANKHDG